MNDDLTTLQAAEILNVSEYHVRDLLQTKRLRGYKLKGKGNLRRRPWRIVRRDLDNYIKEQRVFNDTAEFHDIMASGGNCA